MGVVIPAEFPADHSSAEHRIFRALRDHTPEDWFALHSVGLARHERKPWAEADFVVVTDRVVLCLEVKGGTITSRGGKWFTNDHRLSHSPFEQAGGAAGALKGYLREGFGSAAPVVGWGVLFPNSRFEVRAPYNDPELLYDEGDLSTPIHVFLDRLADYWIRRNDDPEKPTRLDGPKIRELVDDLAPEFSLQPTLSARIHGLAEDFVRLTDDQIGVLEGFSEQDRLLVQGGAGSGKTLLAMAEADRLATDRRVLLGCASSPLSARLKTAMTSVERVDVKSLLTLATSLVAKAGLTERLPDERAADVLAVHLPELALEAFASTDERPYDAIVIDEAQDLIQGKWLSLLDALVDGGLEGGCWRFFHDPNQDLLLGTEVASLDRLERTAQSRYRLTRNCRNTRQIATATAIYSGLGAIDRCSLDGPDVEEHFYRDKGEERQRACSTLRDWIEAGVQPSEIAILSSRPFTKTGLAGAIEDEVGAPIADAIGESRPPGSIAFSTIDDFKGLESDAVLILDIDGLEPGASRLHLYVAMTRAKSLLCLMLDNATEQLYKELVEDFAGRVRSGALMQR